MRSVGLALAMAVLLGGAAARADDFEPALRAFAASTAAQWAADPAVVAAVLAQNAAHASITPDEIARLDAAWKAEVGSADMPTVTPVLMHPLSDRLRAHVAGSGGIVTEVFVTDGLGLNVAVSAPTSDYWQGDEAKFTETFPLGPKAVHLGEVEFDESTQTYQAQISVVVTDPATGEPAGTMTVAVNAESLL